MMSLLKMKISSCLQPHVYLSSRSLAAARRFPRSNIRSRTSWVVRCGSATRPPFEWKPVHTQSKQRDEAKEWRNVVVSGVSIGLVMVWVLGMDAEKAMALGPEGPLMEEFWDNVRRYGLYALTVSTGALSAVFEPIFELLKNPISAILILVILGGSFYIVSQVVSAMTGITEFAYDYGY